MFKLKEIPPSFDKFIYIHQILYFNRFYRIILSTFYLLYISIDLLETEVQSQVES